VKSGPSLTSISRNENSSVNANQGRTGSVPAVPVADQTSGKAPNMDKTDASCISRAVMGNVQTPLIE
jgi:hypothetical protein